MNVENLAQSHPWAHIARRLEVERARNAVIDAETCLDDARRTFELAVSELRTATRLRNEMAERLRRAIASEGRAA